MRYDAVLIAGPTASGKSAAALALAMRIGGVVINADSMQVYAQAPILTAQPSPADKARAPHLLYGHVDARELYSVGRWRDDAAAALAGLDGRMPIFVGGTGLYFMALTEGLAVIPAIPNDIRAGARALLEQIGVAALHARLMTRDPLTASKLRPSDPQRVLRAYEVFEATGRPLAQWQSQPAAPLLAGRAVTGFVLDPPRAELRLRIAARFAAMVEAGGLQEARALEGLDPALPAAKLLGLAPLQALARGEVTKSQALEAAVTATRQFAKRQMTWFRHRMPHYVWLDPNKSNIIAEMERISA
ncbi:MAG TPA: tRNA (adenosine(37)-N6)-dimethylallyltransferase MiaA [Rhizomicrobium sp.]|jgi:tRNA dimethylallyltransferase|nr:tRNA (adenosine(37)-N6)-dimethylallyltransferase MiaA [Rhizomicrobium sp.]